MFQKHSLDTNRGGAVENTTIDWTDQISPEDLSDRTHYFCDFSDTVKAAGGRSWMDNEILAVPLPQEASGKPKTYSFWTRTNN